jgi:hypothetical protein
VNVCVVALGVRREVRVHRIVIRGLYYIFPHYLINGTIFEKKSIQNKMSDLIFSTTLSETVLFLRRNERDMIKYVHWYSCKEPRILVRF